MVIVAAELIAALRRCIAEMEPAGLKQGRELMRAGPLTYDNRRSLG
jgi:hypothetical protein